MLRVLVVMLLAMVALGCRSVATGPSRLQLERQFDAAVPAWMAERAVPGVAIAVIAEGKVAWVKGYGWADKEARLPVTEHTVFQAASISKPVSAWVAMKLVEEGRLDLDPPVSRYLTRWQLPASRFDNGGVTLRRLLSHTAGLSIPGYLGFAPDVPLQTLEGSLARAADAGDEPLAVVSPPGERWEYSGGGYTLMQLLVEQVTGQSFADFARSAVLAPLGMTGSDFAATRANGPRAVGYDRAGRRVPDYRFTAEAAAGLRSTAADLARFVVALFTSADGRPAGRGVLWPASLGEMLSPQPHSESDLIFAGSKWGLGYGLHRLPDGELLVYHPGDNIPAWHALIAALPKRRAGFVVLTNGEAGRELRVDAFCLWFRAQAAGSLAECR